MLPISFKEINCSELLQPSLILWFLHWGGVACNPNLLVKSNRTRVDVSPTANPVIRVLAPASRSVPSVGWGKTSRACHGADGWTQWDILQVHCWWLMLWFNPELTSSPQRNRWILHTPGHSPRILFLSAKPLKTWISPVCLRFQSLARIVWVGSIKEWNLMLYKPI